MLSGMFGFGGCVECLRLEDETKLQCHPFRKRAIVKLVDVLATYAEGAAERGLIASVEAQRLGLGDAWLRIHAASQPQLSVVVNLRCPLFVNNG